MKKILKRTFCVFLVLAIVLCLSACKGNPSSENGNNDDQNGVSQDVSTEVNGEGNGTSQSTSSEGGKQPVTSTPSSSSQQSSSSSSLSSSSTPSKELKEFEKTYRPATVQRISEIRAAKSDIKPQGSGKAYYVSNSGKASNTGLSPSSPLATYAQVKAKGLKSGDVIYFKRGDLWREKIEVTTPGITLTAYGDGAAPKFYNSPENSASSSMWIKTDAQNVYEYKTLINGDIGAIIFDDKECTYKSLYSTADQSNSTSKRYVNSYKNLKSDLQMYHDPKTNKIYVCSTNGNPAARFQSIEIIRLGAAIKITADNVTVDGLCVKYSSFGISASSTRSIVKGLTVRNCEFGWIGGNVQGEPTQTTTRYGNGIEIWGAAENFTVTNCYFWQVYDAGVTFQYRGSVSNDVKNVKFNNNVFEYCNYSIEYFYTGSNGNANSGKVYDFEIKNNHFWYAGEGLSSQRPDRSEISHIRSGWVTQGNAIKIENNLFAISLKSLARTLDSSNIGGVYNNNTYIQYARREFAYNGNSSTPFKADANVKSNIASKLGDKNAKVIIVEN